MLDDTIGLDGRVQEFESGNLRHEEVDKHEVERTSAHQVEGFLPPPGERDVVSLAPQDGGAAFPEGALVIDDQDADRGLDVGGEREHVAARSVRWSVGRP
jgi:hypothetical protein